MKITQGIADVVNGALSRVGVALRLECIDYLNAKRQLEQNPALLQAEGLSQMMAGDIDDVTLEAAKGRPFADPLTQRIMDGEWRWYFGIIQRLRNGATVDGVTRLISIYRSGTKGVWVLTYNDADPSDFVMFDDPDSSKLAQDVFRNAGYTSAIGNVLAVIVPKAAGGADPETGDYHKVARDVWWEFFLQHKEAFVAAAEFVQAERGTDGVVRKNLTALMYFLYVSGPNATKRREAKRLLDAYVNGFVSGPDAWDEKRMGKLAVFFAGLGGLLHERNACLPLFTHVMTTLLRGDDIRFSTNTELNSDTGRKTFTADWTVLKVKKAAVAGR